MSESSKDKQLPSTTTSNKDKTKETDDVKQLTPLEHAQKAIISSLELICRAITTDEYSLISRAHNPVSFIRKNITYDALVKVLEKYSEDILPRLTPYADKIPQSSPSSADPKNDMTDETPEPDQQNDEMGDDPAPDTTKSPVADKKDGKPSKKVTIVVEPQIPKELPLHAKYFLTYIIALYLYEQKLYTESLEVLNQYLFDFSHHPHISYDFMASKVYMLFSNTQEKLQQLSSPQTRALLMKHHSHSHGHYSSYSLSVLTVCILRSFILDKHFAQADQFIRHTSFPPLERIEATIYSRFAYYSGLINAVHLRYSRSLDSLKQALRTATDDITPFHIHIYRLYILVHLLIGQIPDRNIFNIPHIALNLSPYYLEITQAVRRGDVARFNKVVQSPDAINVFVNDGVNSIIGRLRQNVLRAGLKRILTVYSEIPLSKVAELLNIQEGDSNHAVQLIVSKAINDGVIMGAIDPVNGVLISHEHSISQGYQSTEHREDIISRIQFNMSLHDQCKLTLRYPPDDQAQEGNTTSDSMGNLFGMMF